MVVGSQSGPWAYGISTNWPLDRMQILRLQIVLTKTLGDSDTGYWYLQLKVFGKPLP